MEDQIKVNGAVAHLAEKRIHDVGFEVLEVQSLDRSVVNGSIC